jgi:2'-5' RNA ligase
MFSGDNPVLYLPIVKSMELSELHKEIWDQTQPYSDDAKPYYSPQLWVPHITLALMDLTQENLACAIDSIAFEPLELFLQVDNLAVVEQDGMEIGETLHQFKFE